MKAAPLYKEILTMAGGPDRIRGFATDVSNYNPAKDPTNPKRDPHAAASDELGYVADLNKALEDVGITGKGFIIDTSRDGKAYIRTLARQLVQHQGRRPRRAPARRARAARSTRTSTSRSPANPTAPPTQRRRASTRTAPPTTRPPAPRRRGRCSIRT